MSGAVILTASSNLRGRARDGWRILSYPAGKIRQPTRPSAVRPAGTCGSGVSVGIRPARQLANGKRAPAPRARLAACR